MILEMRQIILTYPHSPDVRELMESGMKDLTGPYGVLCEADFEKRTLTVSTTPDRPRLERIFSPIAVAKLIKEGFRIERRYCPKGTRAVAITYSERGWTGQRARYARGYWVAEGFSVEIISRERKVALTPTPGNKNLDDLPFERFNAELIERQIEKIEFIT